MNRLTIVLLLTTLYGCSAPYQKPQTGDTAILILPEIDGTSERTFHIGKLDAKGCATGSARVKEESYSQKDLVHVPAGEDIFVSVRSRTPSTSCTGSAVMNLEANKTYDAVILSFPMICTFTIF